MSADTFEKVNWNRVEELLLKEEFRRLIINNGESAFYMLDTVGYTAAPNVIACFQDDNVWKVYETDDRSNVRKERTFDSACSAYKDAAARRGLIFPASAVINSKMRGITVAQMYKRKGAIQIALQNALQNARKLAELLAGEKSGEIATEDARVLDEALEELKKLPSRLVTASIAKRTRKGRNAYGHAKPSIVYASPFKSKTAKTVHATRESRSTEYSISLVRKGEARVMHIKANIEHVDPPKPTIRSARVVKKGKKSNIISAEKKDNI